MTMRERKTDTDPVDWTALPKTRPRRGGFTPLPVSARLSSIIKGVYAKRGFQDAFLLTHWRDIVGEELAAVSLPEKLSRARARADGKTPPATLTLRVEGAMAIEFKHLEPQILDRINRQYGFHAIGRLKLVQGPVSPPKKERRSLLNPELSQDDARALERMLSQVEEQDLKRSLAELGARVLASRRSQS